MSRGFANVGKLENNRNIKKLENVGNKVTMGLGVPRQIEGNIGDITVRTVPDGLRCYIKTHSGWYDINTMQSAVVTDWIPMVLAGNWEVDDTYGTPEYFKDDRGFVHLRGGVDTGSAASTIATLPVGCRPPKEQRRLVNRVAATGTLYIQIIRITTGGAINRVAGYSLVDSGENVDLDLTAEICLDGISFYAVQKIQSSGGGNSGGGSGDGGFHGGGAG